MNEIKTFDIKLLTTQLMEPSFVYVGERWNPVAPLYNYLKPLILRILEKVL